MTRFLITLSVLCFSWEVQAHQPDLSSIILAEQGDNKWVLQVRSALTAFEYEIEEHFGASSYASPEEFQELVANYVRDNISILFNDTNAAVLQNGMVKLGHETTVVFQLAGTPEAVHSLAVKNSSFSDIPRNQSALIVFKEGFSKDQFILNENNGHSIKLKAGSSKFEAVEQGQETAQRSLLIFAGALLALSVIYFAFKYRQAFRFISPLRNA